MVLPFAMVYELPPFSAHCAHSVPDVALQKKPMATKKAGGSVTLKICGLNLEIDGHMSVAHFIGV